MAARLAIGAAAYVLSRQRDAAWVPLATLEGGAAALLRPEREADEAGLELAIEVAENWLMPYARLLRDQELEVADPSGRVSAGLGAMLGVTTLEWSVEGVEEIFLRLVDIATGRRGQFPPAQRPFLADMLLVRELAHHGGVRGVRVAA